MAITHNGTRLTGNALKIAATVTGYTVPSITVFADWLWVRVAEFAVAKSTVENATPATTFTALVAACDTEMDGWVSNDYVATNTVTTFHEVSDIVTAEAGIAFTNGVTRYTCSIKSYVKVA